MSGAKPSRRSALQLLQGPKLRRISSGRKLQKAEGTKVLQVNRRLQEFKEEARQALTSEAGIEKKKQRATDVEPFFGYLKHNMGMKRYVLRGLVKVEIETGLRVIAHNLAKMAG